MTETLHDAAKRMVDERANRGMRALITSDITVAELARRLRLGGLEMYPDCAGNYCIRTIEDGDKHRAQLEAERFQRVLAARRFARAYEEQEETRRAGRVVHTSGAEPPHIVDDVDNRLVGDDNL
jgi:hypothetical protein